jgi:hypothetical protein
VGFTHFIVHSDRVRDKYFFHCPFPERINYERDIKKLYGTSRTQDGIRLAKGLGFKRVTPVAEEDDLTRFELELATANDPVFKNYQNIVKRASTANPKK